MTDENFIHTVFIGSNKSGKSNIVNRMRDGSFIRSYIPTIGAFHCSILAEDYDFSVKTWEFSGNKVYLKNLPKYIKNTDIVSIVFDISNKNYLKNLKHWIKFTKNKFNKNDATAEYLKEPQIILIANKMDLIDDDKITLPEEFSSYPLFKVSAKNDIGISFLKRYLLFFKGSVLMEKLKKQHNDDIRSCCCVS